jgi:23S rRNA (cytidine1920-2'-O)/16S rRNA (cytidine1409-2'-O)-methyltransferase
VVAKTRIDQLLVSKGLCASREKAQRAIMAGQVLVDGRKAEKPGQQVPVDIKVKLLASERYVSRGGLKLEAALDRFDVSVEGRTCLDIGSSTGGFTDCLLQRGAARIHAVDVGRGQLDWRLRNDPRLVVHEGVNARYLTAAEIAEPVQICVMDVSFISLSLILPAAFALLPGGAEMIVLIKPQFELSPDKVGRGGIVRDPEFRREAVEKIHQFVTGAGKNWIDAIQSPVAGREGNIEFLAHLKA